MDRCYLNKAAFKENFLKKLDAITLITYFREDSYSENVIFIWAIAFSYRS